MHIGSITNNNFEGKFNIPKPLSKREKEFADRLINNYVNGKTNAEYLKDKNFDVDIYSASGKRRIPPKLALIIRLKSIETYGKERGTDVMTIKKEVVSLESGMLKPTSYLRSFVDGVDSYIEDCMPTYYNSGFQKALVKIAMFLRIV